MAKLNNDSMRNLKRSIIVCFVLCLLSLCLMIGCLEKTTNSDNNNKYDVLVTKVIDGDTIVVSFPNETMGTIRFLGIDCPETSIQQNNPYEYHNITNLSCLTSFAHEAKTYVELLLNNSQITIVFDNQTDKKDQYGRFLCYVFIDSTDVNALLLEDGYARVYTLETFSKKAEYLEIEAETRDSLNGLWQCLTIQSKISIAEVHYDAEGNDEQNLNDEYVVLVNNEEVAMDLSGWSIHDDHGNRFDFPPGFSLAPSTSVTIYTGIGTNITTALYWHHFSPVWTNDGDTVFIYNEKDILIETYSW